MMYFNSCHLGYTNSEPEIIPHTHTHKRITCIYVVLGKKSGHEITQMPCYHFFLDAFLAIQSESWRVWGHNPNLELGQSS